jgi:hypothetical protein
MDTLEVRGYGKIAKALAAAQAEMSNPAFDSQNPHFRSRFASLAAVRNAVVPVLSKHGICLTQNLQTQEKGLACFTTLWHESGEYLTFGPLVMPASKPDAQGMGSAATYARRYAMMAVCGVVGDDDDDANSASGKPAPAVAVNAGKGIGIHSPLGDAPPSDDAVQYADAIKESIGDADEIKKIHADLHNEGEELYRSVWALLDAKTRSAFKKIVAEPRAA